MAFRALTTKVALTTSESTISNGRNVDGGVTIWNESGQTIRIFLGDGSVSADLYTVLIPDGSYYETPYGFAGVVKAQTTTGSGNIMVTKVS